MHERYSYGKNTMPQILLSLDGFGSYFILHFSTFQQAIQGMLRYQLVLLLLIVVLFLKVV